MNYVFEHEGKQFTPDGRVEVSATADHNKAVETEEIAYLKTAPEKLFLYVNDDTRTITTWLGTVVSDRGISLGSKVYFGFDGHTFKRHVSTRIFGTLYHGWYFESSGSYCRLKKAKVQK